MKTFLECQQKIMSRIKPSRKNPLEQQNQKEIVLSGKKGSTSFSLTPSSIPSQLYSRCILHILLYSHVEIATSIL